MREGREGRLGGEWRKTGLEEGQCLPFLNSHIFEVSKVFSRSEHVEESDDLH